MTHPAYESVILIPLRLSALSIKLPQTCYPLHAFPYLFIASFINTVTETRTRSYARQVLCIMLRV